MSTPHSLEIEHALERGLDFIYRFACVPQNFYDYGSDLLWCFYLISATSKNRRLRKRARDMGVERARQWRRDFPSLPSNLDADELVDYLFGSSAADKLGVADPKLKKQIKNANSRFHAADYFYFDPAKEPPPENASETCACGVTNQRGRKFCVQCRRRLVPLNRYEVCFYALVRTYSGDRFGVILGARYADAIKWLPKLRPYCSSEDPEFYDAVYFVTHVIYTLNAYNFYKLSPRWLPHEFKFLKKHLPDAISRDDPEMVGEFVDSLRAFGLDSKHPSLRKAIAYLLSKQNEDGSWGGANSKDGYQRYHSTWTAMDGLREYSWHGERLCFPKLLPALKRINSSF
jgi:hypothetical protein